MASFDETNFRFSTYVQLIKVASFFSRPRSLDFDDLELASLTPQHQLSSHAITTQFFPLQYVGFVQLASLAASAQPDLPGSWRKVEACLFGIRSIGRGIPPDEGEVVPRVVAILPRLPGHYYVRNSATLIVGK